MTHCTLESFFEYVITNSSKSYKQSNLTCATCFDPKKYSCFKGMSFEEARQKALESNLDLHINTEHDHFGEHPWEIDILDISKIK